MYYLKAIFFTFIISLSAALKILFLKTDLSHFRPPAAYLKVRGWLIWGMITAYVLFLSVLSLLKYNAYNMAMIDLGRMSQAIWNTLHGKFLVGTFEFGNACRMIAHSELIYLLIAPLYLFFPDAKTLLILQTLLISLGAFAIYKLSRRKFSGCFVPLCFSAAYLLYPSLQYGNLADFHPDMLAVTFLLFAFYYLEEKRWPKYFTFLLLSLLCKEYVSLIALTMGIFVILARRNPKAGLITILLGAVWFLMTYKIIPFYLHGKENMMLDLYAGLGTSIGEVFRTIILHPVDTIRRFITPEKLANLLLLLLPLGFLSLFNLSTLLICLPVLIGLILTPFFSYANHHNGLLIPFIFVSAINAGGYLTNKFSRKFKNIAYALGAFVFTASLFSSIFYGPSPLSWRFWNSLYYRYYGNVHQFKVTKHDRIIDKFVKMIPADAAISVSNHLGAHLSNREIIYHFPYPGDFSRIDYVLVDLLEYFPPEWGPRKDEIDALRELLLDDSFVLLSCEDGILLFKKSGKKEKGCYLKIDKVKDVRPQTLLGGVFDKRLALLGYDLKDKYFMTGKRYRIVYYWRVLNDFKKDFSYTYFDKTEKLNKEYILIDTFRSQKQEFRIIHLPIYILYAPENWEAGEIIREEFDLYFPDDMPTGNYEWRAGLYAAPNFFFIQTENRNLVPGVKEIILGRIEIK